MKRLFFHLPLCVVILFFCVHCSGVIVDEVMQDTEQSETASQEADQQINTEPTTNMDGNPSTQGSSTTVGNPGYQPIPVASLMFHSTLVYAADENAVVPVVIQEGGITIMEIADTNGDGYVDNYQLAISTDETELVLENYSASVGAG